MIFLKQCGKMSIYSLGVSGELAARTCLWLPAGTRNRRQGTARTGATLR